MKTQNTSHPDLKKTLQISTNLICLRYLVYQMILFAIFQSQSRSENCFGEDQFPIFVGDGQNDYDISIIVTDHYDQGFLFGGKDSQSPILGYFYYKDLNSYTRISWMNKIQTKSEDYDLYNVQGLTRISTADLLFARIGYSKGDDYGHLFVKISTFDGSILSQSLIAGKKQAAFFQQMDLDSQQNLYTVSTDHDSDNVFILKIKPDLSSTIWSQKSSMSFYKFRQLYFLKTDSSSIIVFTGNLENEIYQAFSLVKVQASSGQQLFNRAFIYTEDVQDVYPHIDRAFLINQMMLQQLGMSLQIILRRKYIGIKYLVSFNNINTYIQLEVFQITDVDQPIEIMKNLISEYEDLQAFGVNWKRCPCSIEIGNYSMPSCVDVRFIDFNISDKNEDLDQITRLQQIDTSTFIIDVVLQETKATHPQKKTYIGDHKIITKASLNLQNGFTYSFIEQSFILKVDFCYNHLNYTSKPNITDMFFMIGSDPVNQTFKHHNFEPIGCVNPQYWLILNQANLTVKFQIFLISDAFKINTSAPMFLEPLKDQTLVEGQLLSYKLPEIVKRDSSNYFIETNFGQSTVFCKFQSGQIEFLPQIGFSGLYEIVIKLKDSLNPDVQNKYTMKVNVLASETLNITEVNRIKQIKGETKGFL
ncbi:UNKNOWN [Stylonychia lemnae]|uniref:Uncharacterized protein n=1 Tax=Stylonychia lemnae TaxID=5949 RepID=A0A078AGZ4_STYLE|nr:UNKNOWN [Stylonychia lemnae]|eukprot:CDW81540.1 UNKNOWN [Stylonychia lemnae]